jgi:hypothetical protein
VLFLGFISSFGGVSLDRACPGSMLGQAIGFDNEQAWQVPGAGINGAVHPRSVSSGYEELMLNFTLQAGI